MKYENAMKVLAKSVENMDVATRTMASNVCEHNVTARRFSCDLRFICRARLGDRMPNVPTDIVLDEESSAFILYKTSGNDVIIFGDVSMVANATHASHISIDGTFSRCTNKHLKLLTRHAVCLSGDLFTFEFVFFQTKDAQRTKRRSTRSTPLR